MTSLVPDSRLTFSQGAIGGTRRIVKKTRNGGFARLRPDLPCAWGNAYDGRYIIAVFDELNAVTILPVTAYEVPEPS
jgi:hypothetical protein